MINPDNITGKNLKTYKKRCVVLACRIVHYRDSKCWACGRTDGKLDAAHVISRSKGFLFAADTANILLTCCHCHRLGKKSMHSDETWMWQTLQERRPDVYEYCQGLLADYDGPRYIGVQVVQDVARGLREQARSYGIE